MLTGHFSAALLAHQKFPKGTLLYFLILSQFQDLLWFILHYFGLEMTEPSDALEATISNLKADMLYSHDLLPQLIWFIVIFIIGKVMFKKTNVALAGVAIAASHFILDILSGFPHHVFGSETTNIALGFYASNVYLAIGIEVIFCIGTLLYYFKEEAEAGNHLSTKSKAGIISIFSYGIVFMILIAKVSLRDLFGLPEFDLGFNSNIPTLITTYLGMIFLLNHIIRKSNLKKY